MPPLCRTRAKSNSSARSQRTTSSRHSASSYSNSTRSSSSHSTSSCSTSIESTSSGSTATTGGTYTIGVGNFDALQDLRRRIPLQLLPPISILARQAAWIFQIPIVIQPVLILPVPPRKNEDVLQLAHEGDEANIHLQLGFLICLVDKTRKSHSVVDLGTLFILRQSSIQSPCCYLLSNHLDSRLFSFIIVNLQSLQLIWINSPFKTTARSSLQLIWISRASLLQLFIQLYLEPLKR